VKRIVSLACLAPTVALAQPASPTLPEASPQGPAAVSLGSDFGCGLADDGTVRCWGRNGDGQCGGEGDVVPTPRRVEGVDNAAAIDTGYGFACALRTDGSVWCWGDNGHGQLGVGGVEERRVPAEVPGLEDVREIALGGFFGCALQGDGVVKCWGSDDSGNLGSGEEGEDRAEPRPVPRIGRATRLWAGRSHACVRERRGRVRCWGASSHGQAGTRRRVRAARATIVRGLGVNDELVLADSFSCALRDGAVRCWGQNLFNVGDGAISYHRRPVRDARLSGVRALGATKEELCAVVGGEVRCWGVNRRQQLHVPTDEAGELVLAPSAVPGVSDATDVEMGYFTQCLRRASGAWACWGWNRGARISAVGVGSSETHVSTPTRLPW